MSVLLAERSGSTLTLTLNRPDRRNALNAELVAALSEELDRVRDDAACRVVVLTGAGSGFSSGADLAELGRLQTASVDDNRRDSGRLAGLFERMLTHPLPILGAVNGHAIAGGGGLAAACDLVYCVPEARFGFPEVKIGFVPALVAGIVRRRVGEAQVRSLLLTGRLISADEAQRMGLVNELVERSTLHAHVLEVALRLGEETSRSAVAQTKALLARQTGVSLEAALADGAATNALARSTPDCRRGVAAFLAGDRPKWTPEGTP